MAPIDPTGDNIQPDDDDWDDDWTWFDDGGYVPSSFDHGGNSIDDDDDDDLMIMQHLIEDEDEDEEWPEGRDHGLPNDYLTLKPPIVVKTCDTPCPICHCETTYGIVAKVYYEPAGGECWGHYRGCPACTYASPVDIHKTRQHSFPYEKIQ